MTEEEKKDDAATEEAVEETKDQPAGEAGDAPVEEAAAEEKKEEEAPAEEKVEEAAPVEEEPAKEVEMTADQKKVIDMIEKMTVLELHALVKVFEEKFGVSAAAVAVAGAAGGDAGDAEEKSDYVVHLAAVGDSKIGVIKAVKEVLGLGLKEAKDLVEAAPADLKSGVKPEEAEEMKTKLTEAGATVELK